MTALCDHAATDLGIPLLQGQYMAILITDMQFHTQGSLTQVGDVPVNARSIRLIGDRDFAPPAVECNGIGVPMVRLSAFGETATFGGDVSAFAGTTVELRIASKVPTGIVGIDNVTFDPTPIPEPSASIVILLA